MPYYSYNGSVFNKIKSRYSYNGSAWNKIKQRYTWNGSVWNKIFDSNTTPTFLYLNGNENTGVTGGWAKATLTVSHIGVWVNNVTSGFTKDPTYIRMMHGGVSGVYGGVSAGTLAKVDFTNINTIRLTFSVENPTDNYLYTTFCLASGYGSINTQENMGYVQVLNISGKSGTFTWTLDVSAVKGSLYALVGTFTSDNRYGYVRFNALEILN